MKGSNQNWINAGLGLAVVVFSITTWVSYRSLGRLSETSNWVNHTHEALEEVEALMSAVREAETGQRGYLITGDEHFLGPYQSALSRIDPLFQSVRNKTADNPDQQRRLTDLQPLIARRLMTLQEVLDLRKKEGFSNAVRQLTAGRGREEMDAVRKAISEMKDEERRLLKARENRSAVQTRETVFTLSMVALFAVSLFILIFYLLNREIAERKRTERALSKQTDILKSVLSSMGEGVIVADLNGRFLIWNPTAERIMGRGPADLPHQEWTKQYEVYLPDQVTPYPSDRLPLVRAIRGEAVDGDELFLRHPKAPEGVWVSVNGRPLRDGAGGLIGGVVVISDVTKRKRTEQELKRTGAFLDSIVENIPIMLFIKDAKELRFIRFNKAGEELLGRSREELIGKNDYNFFPKEQADLFTAKDRQVIAEGRLADIPEEPIETRLRGTRTLHTRKIPVFDEMGQPLYLLGISEDITDRKRAETQFRRVLESAPDAIVIVDQEGRIVLINTQTERLFEYGREELLGEKIEALVPEHFRGNNAGRRNGDFGDPGPRAMGAGEALFGRRKDGSEFPVEISLSPLETEEGMWFMNSIRDVTDRKRVEQALREKEEESRSIIETATSGFIKIDAGGLIVDWNRQAQIIFGWPRSEAIGRSLAETIIPAEYREAHRKGIERFLATGEGPVLSKRTELTALHRDGHLFPVEVTIWPLQAREGYYFNAFINDITQRKDAEKSTQQANARLTELVGALEARKREMFLLSEMGELLQTCRTLQEADGVVGEYIRQLFPEESGAFYLLAASRNLVEKTSSWGSAAPEARFFAPDECWALRRGQIHKVQGASGLTCHHTQRTSEPATYLCIPMQAQNDMLGILHLVVAEPGSPQDSREIDLKDEQMKTAKQKLAVTVTEQIALALSNLRLRETLRNQAIRDPLTGLFNRRYLEETLNQEISRAERNNQPIAVIMIDIDHFKQYNDTYGHEAGDVVLSELGRFLERSLRGGDTPCRYGGEEFSVILPGASPESALLKAERLRNEVKELDIHYRGRSVGGITLSLGVAGFPDHGSIGETLLRAADQALYQAKGAGRDRAVIAAALPGREERPSGRPL